MKDPLPKKEIQMEYEIEFYAEFDCLTNTGKIEIRTNLKDPGLQEVVIVLDTIKEIIIMSVCRDQWGVWYSLMNAIKDPSGKLSHYFQPTTIAQKDGTRSFMDALIKTLIHVKNENEATIYPENINLQ